MTYSWKRFGGYECSSAGDSRFSAFNARLEDGRTIEQHYQCDVKGYDQGGTNWRLGKGKQPLIKRDLWPEYLALWERWVLMNQRNQGLLVWLADEVRDRHNCVLSDRFATTPINQAHALAELINKYITQE